MFFITYFIDELPSYNSLVSIFVCLQILKALWLIIVRLPEVCGYYNLILIKFKTLILVPRRVEGVWGPFRGWHVRPTCSKRINLPLKRIMERSKFFVFFMNSPCTGVGEGRLAWAQAGVAINGSSSREEDRRGYSGRSGDCIVDLYQRQIAMEIVNPNQDFLQKLGLQFGWLQGFPRQFSVCKKGRRQGFARQ